MSFLNFLSNCSSYVHCRKTRKIKFCFRCPVKSKNDMYDTGDFWNENAHDTYIGNG